MSHVSDIRLTEHAHGRQGALTRFPSPKTRQVRAKFGWQYSSLRDWIEALVGREPMIGWMAHEWRVRAFVPSSPAWLLPSIHPRGDCSQAARVRGKHGGEDLRHHRRYIRYRPGRGRSVGCDGRAHCHDSPQQATRRGNAHEAARPLPAGRAQHLLCRPASACRGQAGRGRHRRGGAARRRLAQQCRSDVRVAQNHARRLRAHIRAQSCRPFRADPRSARAPVCGGARAGRQHGGRAAPSRHAASRGPQARA